MNNAKLFIISAPSGCGKGTLLKELRKDFDFYLSVSCTTRAPREGEQDGVHYHFISQERFDEMIDEDGFLEYARFDNRSYGTPKKNVEENLAENIDVILEIEPQGAFQVKKKRPDAVMLFILPPSVESLNRRLHRRAAESGETEQQIQARLATARGDIEKAYDYDYVMVNGDLDKAVSDMKKIFTYAKNGDEAIKEFSAENNRNIIDEVLKNA
ncbi:MAG: guanylate kinase [Oscillospiraceae bacterium]